MKVITDEQGYVKEVKIETCEWNPTAFKVRVGVKPSQSVKNLKAMQVGEVKRIIHPDLKCQIKKYNKGNGIKSSNRQCALQSAIYDLKKKGWELEQYHEKDHIMVIRRLK